MRRRVRTVQVVALALAVFAWVPCASGGPGDGDAELADEATRRLGEAIHLERIRGDLAAAEAIYGGLFGDLPPGHALRAEVCFRLLAVRLRRGDVAGARAPLRELKNRHRRPDLTARAEALIERALAPWSLPIGDRPRRDAPILAVSEDGRSVAAWAGPGFAGSPGQRLLVFRDAEAVARALLLRVDRGLMLVRVVAGEVRVGDRVPVWSEPPTAPEPSGGADPARVSRAQRLVAGHASPRRSGAAAVVAGPPAEGALRVWVLSCEPAALATLPLRFTREGAAEAGAPRGPGLVARVAPAALRDLLRRVAAAAGPRGPISVLRRFDRVVVPQAAAGVQLEVGTSRLPVGAAHSVFEGLRVSLARAPGAAGAVRLRASTRDLPAEGVAFPAEGGRVTSGVPSTQGLDVSIELSRAAPAAVIAGLDDPFAVGAPGTRRRQLLILVMAPSPEGPPSALPGDGG